MVNSSGHGLDQKMELLTEIMLDMMMVGLMD